MIRLGPNSPLLTKGGRKRALGPDERDIQIAVMEVLVGALGPGEGRSMDKGMCRRYPELMLLYAINPNKGGRKKAAAGIAKAMGLLPNLPDLHLPVMRGPFIGLYVELKRPKQTSTFWQRALQADLRAEGHCVVEVAGSRPDIIIQRAVSLIVGYLALPRNRPSVRPLGTGGGAGVPLDHRLLQWRDVASDQIQGKGHA